MIACKKTVIILIIVLVVLFFLFGPLLAGEVYSKGKECFNNSPLNEVLKEGGEQLYKKFAQEATDKGAGTKFYCAERRGDRFFYQNNKLK